MSEDQNKAEVIDDEAAVTFPGEKTGTDDETKEEKDDTRRPWLVCSLSGTPGLFNMVKDGFRLQSEADEYIRTNITDDETLCSMRKGKAFEAVRKTSEVDF